MKAAIYSRFSTDLQDRTSIAGQVANAEALASREGLEIVARFQDEGRSGNDDSRTGYQAMLAALKRGDFAGIITDETSRITRNQAELHRLVAELRFRDQFLITCDGIDTRSEASEIILSVKAAIDQMEGRKIGLRTYRSLRERHKDGNSAGGRIFGYTSVEHGEYRRRVLHDEQAEIVREIFERYVGGESSKAIARDLNRRGVPSPGSYWNNKTRRSLGWTHTTLTGAHTKATGILRNPIYTGRHTWNKRKGKKVPGTAQRIQQRRPDSEWIEVQDDTLRIIPDALYEAAQKRLEASRRGSNGRGRPARYLLSGVLKCGCCGASYVMANDRNYRCSSQTNGRESVCDQRRVVNRKVAEEQLLSGIKAELLAPKVIKSMAKEVRSRLRKIERPNRSSLEAELKRIERQIGNVVDSLSSVGTSHALTAKLRELEEDQARVKDQLVAEASPPRIVPNVEKALRERVKLLDELPRDCADPDLMEKARASVKAMLGDVRVVEDSAGIYAEVDFGRAYINYGAEERT